MNIKIKVKKMFKFILNGKRDLYFKKHGGVTLDID